MFIFEGRRFSLFLYRIPPDKTTPKKRYLFEGGHLIEPLCIIQAVTMRMCTSHKLKKAREHCVHVTDPSTDHSGWRFSNHACNEISPLQLKLPTLTYFYFPLNVHNNCVNRAFFVMNVIYFVTLNLHKCSFIVALKVPAHMYKSFSIII